MATIKTEGIVLKKINFGETDKILTIYTKNFGKISAIAKGVRRPTSKLTGHLDLFCLSDLMLAEGRNLYTVISAELNECFLSLREKLRPTSQAFLMAEILNKISRENEKNERIYQIFIDSLKQLGRDKNNLILPYFQLQLIILSGFRPHFQECVSCQIPLEQGKHFFSSKMGGILDENCSKADAGAFAISNNSIKILRFLAENDLDKIKKLKVSLKESKEAEIVLRNYLEYILEGKINSGDFLEKF